MALESCRLILGLFLLPLGRPHHLGADDTWLETLLLSAELFPFPVDCFLPLVVVVELFFFVGFLPGLLLFF